MVHMAMATAVVGDLMISVVHGVKYHQILNGRGNWFAYLGSLVCISRF